LQPFHRIAFHISPATSEMGHDQTFAGPKLKHGRLALAVKGTNVVAIDK
jgi:hypothetical protein